MSAFTTGGYAIPSTGTEYLHTEYKRRCTAYNPILDHVVFRKTRDNNQYSEYTIHVSTLLLLLFGVYRLT